jgi:hypothetical protein
VGPGDRFLLAEHDVVAGSVWFGVWFGWVGFVGWAGGFLCLLSAGFCTRTHAPQQLAERSRNIHTHFDAMPPRPSSKLPSACHRNRQTANRQPPTANCTALPAPLPALPAPPPAPLPAHTAVCPAPRAPRAPLRMPLRACMHACVRACVRRVRTRAHCAGTDER